MSSAAPRVSAEQAVAFRLHGHHLDERLPAKELLRADGACGLQSTPPGTAALALHARLDALTPERVTRALEEDKTLVKIWSLRAAEWLVPTRDLDVFTLGALPDDEEGLRYVLWGFTPQVLDTIGMDATEAVLAAADAVWEALEDGRALTKRELGPAMTPHMPPALHPWLTAEMFPGWGARLANAVALRGTLCFLPGTGAESKLIRSDAWLGRPLPPVDETTTRAARAELVRRFLRCYGPAMPSYLGEWAGISGDHARALWTLVEGELAEVRLEGRTRWVLAMDLPVLLAPPAAEGVRILPPSDPFMHFRDRETLLPDKKLHPRIWRAGVTAGVVFVDGALVALWRPQKHGKRFVINVDPLAGPLGRGVLERVEQEAQTLAPFRGCASAEVRLA